MAKYLFLNDDVIAGWAHTDHPTPPVGAIAVEYDGAFPTFTNTVWKVIDGIATDTGDLPYVRTYMMERVAAYPSIPDQLDTLFHGGYDAWKAEIQAVKDEFPKPGE